MRTSEFMMALNALCHERDLSKEVVIQAVERALLTAYKRDYGGKAYNPVVKIDPVTGDARVYVDKEVVEEVMHPHTEISLEEARQFEPDAQIGDVIKVEITPKDFGRIAAQTAKQVIMQAIREAERDKVYADFINREGEIVVGTVQGIDAKTGTVRLSLGRAEAVMPRQEQIPTERYRPGQRVRVYVYEVKKSQRGPQIYVSRTHRDMLRRLLELEVPEIANGTVIIKGIAREPGARSKVAVWATQEGVDPVGACVGMKGIRNQSIVNELNGEKIDVVEWSPDEAVFVANALSPAKVAHVFLDPDHPEGKTALVIVPDNQLSLAIGKGGQNARLAAKLTGWRIDIKSASEAADEALRRAEMEAKRRMQEEQERLERERKIEEARRLLEEAQKALAEEEGDEEETAVAAELDTPEEIEPEPVAVAPEPQVEQVEEVAVEEEEEDDFFEEDFFEEEEEEDEEDFFEEPKRTKAKGEKPSLADLFYTLDNRGQQVELEDEIRKRRKERKGGKKSKKKGR